ncbi:MAG: thioester domain-containing protein [Desulfarculaceae bacterium]|nr:thioester domain-containing protein [Desulfarculaceae bacterium]MCF8073922.1 thioester domain-containing protein [Desulfarculaceae bacterium]MCF8102608.1 thioester domain-containing protein [Desulfarculaceae bacterium]MCF8117623.1 thioester domain-containing protein [Desulfarculaceae bacterium]
MRMIKFSIACALGLLLLLSSGLAMADTMSVAHRGNKSVTVWVDGNRRNAITAEFYTPNTYQDAMWFGYCVDPLQSFKNPITPGDPDLWSGPEISPPVTNYDWREVAWLMENYAPGVSEIENPGTVNYGSAAVKLAIQAVQLAIWEVTLDHSTTYTSGSITNSSSRFYTLSSTVASMAGSYLVALSEYKSTHGGNISLTGEYLINDQGDRQDLTMGTSGAGTPEPATMLLMGSALAAGAGFFRRRRRRKA